MIISKVNVDKEANLSLSENIRLRKNNVAFGAQFFPAKEIVSDGFFY